MKYDEMLKRLDELRQLEDGWDSYGGLAISERAADVAESILDAIQFGGLPSPSPSPDGGIELEWKNGLTIYVGDTVDDSFVCAEGIDWEVEEY